jgi:predicted peptidase
MTLGKLALVVFATGYLLGLAQTRAADKDERGFLNRTYKDADGTEAKYVVFVPHEYKGDKPYPLILFLHGRGETGSDGVKQTMVGLGPAVEKQGQTFGFIAVFPQAQKPTWSAHSEEGKRALKILDEVMKRYKVDAQGVYLTGLSMGGYGTWSMAIAHPERWAAIVPVCGGGDSAQAAKIKHIPCWCFHGGADKTVPAAGSRKWMDALKAAGGMPKYTEYPDVGHNSWDKAYGTAELYDWLLMQKLPDIKR